MITRQICQEKLSRRELIELNNQLLKLLKIRDEQIEHLKSLQEETDKKLEERVENEAIKFADEVEEIENHEICPFLSYQGILVRRRKDCGIYWKQLRKCAIKGLAEYFGYRRG